MFGTRYYSTRKTPGVYRRSTRYAVGGIAKKKYGRRRILSVIRSIAEHKYSDQRWSFDGGSDGLVTSNGVIMSLTIPPVGNSDTTRVGDKVHGTSLEFSHVSYPQFTTLTFPAYSYRITIFVWKDDTDPLFTDIYKDPVNFIGQIKSEPILFPFNHDKKVKRKILFDRSFTAIAEVNTTANLANSENAHKLMKIVIPLTKLKNALNVVNYQAESSIGVNKIYAIISNNIPPSLIPDVHIPFAHYVHVRYNYIDV